jgi:hypothetical protein
MQYKRKIKKIIIAVYEKICIIISSTFSLKPMAEMLIARRKNNKMINRRYF